MGKCCKNCVHFIMHYVRFRDKYMSIDFGHCVFPRVKSRDAMAKACVHYEPLQDENTKEPA